MKKLIIWSGFIVGVLVVAANILGFSLEMMAFTRYQDTLISSLSSIFIQVVLFVIMYALNSHTSKYERACGAALSWVTFEVTVVALPVIIRYSMIFLAALGIIELNLNFL